MEQRNVFFHVSLFPLTIFQALHPAYFRFGMKPIFNVFAADPHCNILLNAKVFVTHLPALAGFLNDDRI